MPERQSISAQTLRIVRMPKNSKGYTLLELIVVVVLLGMVFSFTAPKFRDAVLNDSLKSATRILIGKINVLRSSAIQENTDYFLKFDLEKNEYWHEYATSSAEGKKSDYEKSVESLPHDVRITDIWFKDKGKKMAGEPVIRFTKRGYAQQSAIHLESEDGREFTILINQFLPKTKVMEDYVEFEDT